MSEKDPYHKTGIFRKHRAEIDERAKSTREIPGFDEEVYDMFGIAIGRYPIEEAILEDIEDYIAFMMKRNAAGALASRAYHYEVVRMGITEDALKNFAPYPQRGHDAMHGMFAYLRTKGASFRPAYMLLERKGQEESDRLSILEERYVEEFGSNFSRTRRIIQKYVAELARATDPGERLAELWARDEVIFATKEQREYSNQHRLPEFTSIARNVYEEALRTELKGGTFDRYFALKEFQRLMQPVLERLRKARVRRVEKK